MICIIFIPIYYCYYIFSLLLYSLFLFSNIISIIAVMTSTIIDITHLIDIIATIVCDCTCTQKWCLALRNGFNSQNAFVYIWGICYSKNIVKSRWSVHHRFGRQPQETGVQHHLCPPEATRAGRYRAQYSAECLSCRYTAEWIQ